MLRRLLHRDHDLAVADAALGDLHRGELVTLVIEGPRGIGKSALLTAVSERSLKPAVYLRARCHDAERGFAFGVVHQLFDPYMASTPDARPVPRRRSEGPPAADEMLYDFYSATRTLADARPVIIAIDDLPASDPESARWLSYATRRLEGLPVGFFITADSDDVRGADLVAEILSLPNARRLRLQPLCDSCVEEYVTASFDAAPQPELLSAIGRACNGNPQVLRLLVSRLLAESAQPWQLPAETVQAMIAATLCETVIEWLRRSRPRTIDLLEQFAVLGDEVDLDLAAVAVGEGELGASVAREALAQAGVIEAGPPDRFVTEQVRAAVVKQIEPARRSELHVQAASMLFRTGAPASHAAEHLMSVGPTGADWAEAVLRRAASEAASSGRWAEAGRYLRRALAEVRDGVRRPALIRELGAVEAHQDVAESLRHMSIAFDAAAGATEWAEAVAPFATTVLTVSSATAGAMIASAAEGLAVDRTSADRGLLPRLSAEALLSGRPAGAREAVRVMRRQSPDVATRHLLAARAVTVAASGRGRNLALALAARAADGLAPAMGYDGSPAVACALALAWSGSVAEAAQWASRAVTTATRRNSRPERTLALILRSDIALRSGSLAAALADARAAMRLAAAVNAHDLSVAALACAIRALTERGELDEAAGLAAEPGDAAVHPVIRASALEARGRLALARGRARDALAHLRECGRVLRPHGIVNPAVNPWRLQEAIARTRLGDVNAARELLAENIRLARRWGDPGEIGVALAAAGFHQDPPGLDELAEAATLMAGTDRLLDHAWVLAAQGAALRAAGDENRAREVLHRALHQASSCGGAALAARIGEQLAMAGARRRDGAPFKAAPLTASERRVAEIVLQGKSNLEVAAELCISKRTVDTHLARVYRKLGIRGRSGLAAALRESPAPGAQAATADG